MRVFWYRLRCFDNAEVCLHTSTTKIKAFSSPLNVVVFPFAVNLPYSQSHTTLMCFCHCRLVLLVLEFPIGGIMISFVPGFFFFPPRSRQNFFNPSIFLHASWVPLFLLLARFTSCGYSTICLSIHLSGSIWVVFSFWPLWVWML